MKSSFSARVAPGAVPSWNEMLIATSEAAFVSLQEEAQPGSKEAAARAAVPVAEVFRNDLLSISYGLFAGSRNRNGVLVHVKRTELEFLRHVVHL